MIIIQKTRPSVWCGMPIVLSRSLPMKTSLGRIGIFEVIPWTMGILSMAHPVQAFKSVVPDPQNIPMAIAEGPPFLCQICSGHEKHVFSGLVKIFVRKSLELVQGSCNKTPCFDATNFPFPSGFSLERNGKIAPQLPTLHTSSWLFSCMAFLKEGKKEEERTQQIRLPLCKSFESLPAFMCNTTQK